jgi:hypothetical protein
MAVLTTGRARGSYAMAQLGSLVALAALLVALLIGAAICLIVYAPHTGGSLVHWVRHAGAWLTGPFHGMVTAHGDHRVIVNWGIAAAVYLVGGTIVARLIRMTGRV